MLNAETPLIEDLNAALRYCIAVREQLRALRTTDIPQNLQVVAVWGIRHAERSAADALQRALRCVANDVDEHCPESFEELLDQLQRPGARRPAFLSPKTQQYILFLRNISLVAALPIMPAQPQTELDNALQGAKASTKILGMIIKELEQLRDWCMANLSLDT